MALPRKRPGDILKRDREFTRTIGKSVSDKPNPFNMVGKELVEKLAAARPAEVSAAPPADLAPVEQAIQSEQVTVPDLPATEHPPQSGKTGGASERPNGEAPGTAKAEHGVEIAAVAEAPDSATGAASTTKEPAAGRAGDTDTLADVVITMRIHTDLVKRAETWAAAVGLPLTTLMRNSLNRFKPVLLEELKTIKAGDVHLERSESVGHHMQTRVRFTPAEIADMETRLDPAGFGVLRSMLNHYARARFSSFLDERLADAGY